MYTEEVEEALLAGDPDFVLDAIDNINTKVRHERTPGGWYGGSLVRSGARVKECRGVFDVTAQGHHSHSGLSASWPRRAQHRH